MIHNNFYTKCKNCPDRATGDKDCHSTCDAYLQFKKDIDELKKRNQNERPVYFEIKKRSEREIRYYIERGR